MVQNKCRLEDAYTSDILLHEADKVMDQKSHHSTFLPSSRSPFVAPGDVVDRYSDQDGDHSPQPRDLALKFHNKMQRNTQICDKQTSLTGGICR